MLAMAAREWWRGAAATCSGTSYSASAEGRSGSHSTACRRVCGGVYCTSLAFELIWRGRGPARLGGTVVCLGKSTDLSETRGRAGLPTRRSVHVVKALRSPTQLAMARGTTKPDSKKHVVVSVQVQKSGDILPFGVQALAAEDVLEWLQPSGRRPEGCCCSTELSGGRSRELGVAGYYIRPIMHAPHRPQIDARKHSAQDIFQT